MQKVGSFALFVGCLLYVLTSR